MSYSSTKCGITILFIGAAYCVGSAAWSYPEFQQFSEKSSGRAVDCAMCHVNEHGPVGQEDGQIGTLTPEELNLLSQARAAMEPGSEVKNPVLNAFGNDLVKSIGMKQVLEAKSDPQKLVTMLGEKRDFDGDGIADAKEILQGTDPSNKFHGEAWGLFTHNLNKYRTQVLLAGAAIFLLDFGLANIIKAMHANGALRRKH